MKINLYEIGPHWVAAKNIRDACREYETVGCGMLRREILEELNLVSNKEMDRLTYLDDVYNPEDCNKRSFRDHLHLLKMSNEKFPMMFATLEY